MPLSSCAQHHIHVHKSHQEVPLIVDQISLLLWVTRWALYCDHDALLATQNSKILPIGTSPLYIPCEPAQSHYKPLQSVFSALKNQRPKISMRKNQSSNIWRESWLKQKKLSQPKVPINRAGDCFCSKTNCRFKRMKNNPSHIYLILQELKIIVIFSTEFLQCFSALFESNIQLYWFHKRSIFGAYEACYCCCSQFCVQFHSLLMHLPERKSQITNQFQIACKFFCSPLRFIKSSWTN